MGFKWSNIKYCFKASLVYGLIAFVLSSAYLFIYAEPDQMLRSDVFATQAMVFFIVYGIALFLCNSLAFAYGSAYSFHAIVILIFISLVIDKILAVLGIPVNVSDVFLITLSLFIDYIIYAFIFIRKDKPTAIEPAKSWIKKIGYTLFFVLLVVIGFWLTYLGYLAPLELSEPAVKAPSVHGYTWVMVGLSVSLLSLVLLVDLLIISRNKN